jgi:rhodanese-related sulfurtransferase
MFSFLKKLFGPGTDYKALTAAGAIIIDVRSPQEFDRGHIQGSKNIPVNIIQREKAGDYRLPERRKKWDGQICIKSGRRGSI